MVALVYQHIPELRADVVAWEYRAVAATVGLCVVYVLVRIHFQRRPASASFLPRCSQVAGRIGISLALGLVPAWCMWSLVDPIADHFTLIEIWEVAPIRPLALCTLGWVAWSVLGGELLLLTFRAAPRLLCAVRAEIAGPGG
jgi:hypothetical protein